MSKGFWVAVLLIVSLASSAAFAVLDADQQKCQKTVGSQGGGFLKKMLATIEKCRNKISAGDLAPTTDCLLEPATAAKIADYETTLRGKLVGACNNPAFSGLVFGGDCSGAATADALATCVIQTHKDQVAALVNTAYGVAEVLGRDQQGCQKKAAKSAAALVSKQHVMLRKCKDKVSSGKLPAATVCTTYVAADLAALHTKLAAKIASSCPNAITATLAFDTPCAGATKGAGLATCLLRAHADGDEGMILVEYGSNAAGGASLAKAITDTADCVAGPLSRCRVGDYLIKNDKIRVVVQGVQRNLFGIGQFGGQIIDADLVRLPLDPDRDSFEEWSTSINIENTAHYTSIAVLNNGDNGEPAVIRATGVDDLLDFLNPSSTIAGLGFSLISSADDKDLPIEVQTDYILQPGRNYVRVETTLQNVGGTQLNIFFGDFLNGSGQLAEFQQAYGFGEPLATLSCNSLAETPCDAIVYAGVKGAAGVSYGYINDESLSSSFTTSGVSVPLLGVEVLFALTGQVGPNHVLEPMGDPGDSKTFTRHFVVGNGTVSSILDARNEIQMFATGTLQGTVTAAGSAVAGAQIAVLGNSSDGPALAPLTRYVASHTLTDASGNYSLTLPPGSYNVVANIEGYPFEGGGASPTQHPVVIAANESSTVDMALPATGQLQVNAVDESSNPIAAKVSVIGLDPSPDPGNRENILGLIRNSTGVFNDPTNDGLVYGLAYTDFAGLSGSIGPVPLEPGSYRVVVSHGIEYSAYTQDITVSAGATSTVNAQLARVTDTTGLISGDFHVHSIDSADCRISRADRVVSMLAEGVDFFTPSDHDYRSDFAPTIAALGAGALIKTATSAEITTFDYGHFIAWPLSVDPTKVNGGSIDFGGAAPDGQDFPSFGNYSLTPGEIIAAARADGATTVQINHVHSYFGLGGGSGLAIDTGLTPPQSAVPGAGRRLNPAITNYFPDAIDRPDALELWIGDDRSQVYTNFLGRNIGDWFNLINQGIVKTGVADSDTHQRIGTQAGMPRNMIASDTDAPGSLVGATVSANVDAGRSFGTNGPIVRIATHATSTGEDGGLGLGESKTISTTDGEVDIEVDIQSPIWAQFDRVEYYINTTTTKTTASEQSGAGPIDVTTYSITPDYVQNAGTNFSVDTVVDNPAIQGASHLEASTTLHLSGLTQDIWVVILVRGTDGISRPLFPVVPNSLLAQACSNDPCKSCTVATVDDDCGAGNTCTISNASLAELTDGNLGQCGMTAMAFTNPLFVDVDGSGCNAPGVQVY